MSHRASGLSFGADPFDGPSGLGLLGFYVATKALKQPLMCLNTAHHRTAVNWAFWHEMGHHLTARFLSPQEGCTALSFGSDFNDHLGDPRETRRRHAGLVCYSHSPAERLFGQLLRKGSAENIHMVFSAARTLLNSVWGFNFDKQIPATQNLHYPAGMIHIAKLRLALLAGYDI